MVGGGSGSGSLVAARRRWRQHGGGDGSLAALAAADRMWQLGGGAVVAAVWQRQLGSIGNVAATAVAAWAAAWWR